LIPHASLILAHLILTFPSPSCLNIPIHPCSPPHFVLVYGTKKQNHKKNNIQYGTVIYSIGHTIL
jgi:hypothetical protein